MTQNILSAKSPELIALVWQELSKEEQHKAIDLISNLLCDYYLSQRKLVSVPPATRKGAYNDESNGRK